MPRKRIASWDFLHLVLTLKPSLSIIQTDMPLWLRGRAALS